MNSGNLLNSLLGATSNNPVANKNTAAKNRAEANEKFCDALEQARPDVAAAKPRKPEDAPRKAEPARTAEPHAKARPSTRQADKSNNGATAEKAHTRQADQQKPATADSAPVKRTDETQESKADRPDGNTESAGQVGDSQSDAAADGVVNPELINQLIQQQTLTSTGDTGAEGDLTAEAIVEQEGLLPSPLSDATATDVDAGLVPGRDGLVTQQGQDLPVDTEIDPTLADTGVGLPAVAGVLSATDPLAAGQRTGTDTAQTMAPAIQSLAVDTATADDATSLVTETAVDADADDNPDFFTLLNTKPGLSRLMDSGTVADKVSQAEPVKPALASTPLAEPLSRLLEPQSPAARSFVVQTGVPVTVGQPQWSQAVGEKVLWLAAQNVSAAEIRLDPPDLGPMHVKVSVNQDQASVTFTSPHPVVRDALDQQLNRLREMFSEQGLNLVNVDVSDRPAQQEQGREQGGNTGIASEVDDDEPVPVAMTSIVSTRLVDHYA